MRRPPVLLFFRPRCLMMLAALLCLLSARAVRANEAVFRGQLGEGWQNWSWGATPDFATSDVVRYGRGTIAAKISEPWGAVYLHTDRLMAARDYKSLRFWINGGGEGGQRIKVIIYDAVRKPASSTTIHAIANMWTKHEISLDAALMSPIQPQGPKFNTGASTGSRISAVKPSAMSQLMLSGVAWQEDMGRAGTPVFFISDTELVERPAPSAPAAPPALSVDAAAGRHAISPLIYGMNFAEEALAAELRLPVRRWGGNATTRYNWRNDTANHAMDWYFENAPEDNPDPSKLPDGSTVDRFVEQDRRTSTKTILNMPLIGWTPKARAYAGGFSVAKYGAQQAVDPWRSDCGNGIRTDGTKITGNDPADTSIAITPEFARQWIAHLRGRYGDAASGGVAFYNLDNEPDLWSETHRDVRPMPLSYDEIRNRAYQYAAAIKAADPTAATLGPVSWGWTAYFYSNLDWAAGGEWWNSPRDRNAHSGIPFTDWYLQQMRAYEQTTGTRILDYLDVHFYPQAPGIALSPAGSAATQALRLRSTRALWDPAYADESWIGEPVRLLPRMRDWVRDNYPGTKIALTEYNWGALNHINGALAQADILGILGREGADLAAVWDPPKTADPGAYAFRMYLNYDGVGAAFGDTAVRAASTDRDVLSIYAAQRGAAGDLTIIVINKSNSSQASTLTLTNFNPSRKAEIWRYSSANLNIIVRQADLAVTGNGFSAIYPAASITLIVLHPQPTRVDDWMRTEQNEALDPERKTMAHGLRDGAE
ncbi:MAG: glycoside hydrolase family 44 protein [Candidatus Sumerlaeota bacterium]|nr:glycoside hydrolase family 44 protein [Candidatus Sumerlaeota bacterium]